MTSDPRWTEETEQLVAMFGPHADPDVASRRRCLSCRDWARSVLTELADAGLLIEPGSTRYEFAHEHVLSDGPGPCLPIHDHTCPDSRYRRTVHTGPWRLVELELQP